MSCANSILDFIQQYKSKPDQNLTNSTNAWLNWDGCLRFVRPHVSVSLV